MSSYHPENDPANPDRPGRETADAGADVRRASKDSAGTANPDPAEDQMSGDQGHGE